MEVTTMIYSLFQRSNCKYAKRLDCTFSYFELHAFSFGLHMLVGLHA